MRIDQGFAATNHRAQERREGKGKLCGLGDNEGDNTVNYGGRPQRMRTNKKRVSIEARQF